MNSIFITSANCYKLPTVDTADSIVDTVLTQKWLKVMSAELTIYGAAYGPNDVTAKVRSLRKEQRFSFTVNNETFGDSWYGVRKSLVVVYTYSVSHGEVLTTIVEEGG